MCIVTTANTDLYNLSVLNEQQLSVRLQLYHNYGGFILQENIFVNFTDLLLCTKVLFANTVSPIQWLKYENTMRNIYSRNTLMPLILE